MLYNNGASFAVIELIVILINSITCILASDGAEGIDLGQVGRDGNYTGIYGLLQRNEADTSSLMERFGFGPKFVDMAFPSSTYEASLIHSPKLSSRARNLFAILQVFNSTVLFSILVSTIIVSISFYGLKISNCSTVFKAIYEAGRGLINQHNLNTIRLIARHLLLVWLLSSFNIMEVFENGMNAELVSNDYSQVIESLDDLVRLTHYEPVFIRGEYVGKTYSSRLDHRFAEIRNRKSTKVISANPVEAAAIGNPEQVCIGTSSGVIAAGKLFCAKFGVDRKSQKFLISKGDFGSVDVAAFYRKELDSDTKNWINLRYLRGAAGSISLALFDKMVRNALGFSASLACIRWSKEELYDDVKMVSSIGLTNSLSLFASGLLLLFVCLLVLLSEILKANRSTKDRK